MSYLNVWMQNPQIWKANCAEIDKHNVRCGDASCMQPKEIPNLQAEKSLMREETKSLVFTETCVQVSLTANP